MNHGTGLPEQLGGDGWRLLVEPKGMPSSPSKVPNWSSVCRDLKVARLISGNPNMGCRLVPSDQRRSE
jgi:hypothetical protein